jgi:hypothetical protein
MAGVAIRVPSMWSSSPAATAPPGPWIHSRRWDLLFLFASVVLVGVPITSYWLIARATGIAPESFQHNQALGIAMLINLGSAFFVGGPHMYATFTFTLAEQRFRERHRSLFFAAALVPVAVIALTILRIEILMLTFFAWAGLHALHQIVYVVQQYQMRAGPEAAPAAWSRALDALLAFTSLYPIATWRLLAPPGAVLELPFGLRVNAGFSIGKVDLARVLPEFLHGATWIAGVVAAVFALACVGFLLRTLVEVATRRAIWPRTLFLCVTVPVAFSLPLFDNLDVALQGFNLWHSTQYLGLVYLINTIRRERDEISSPWVFWLAGSDRWLRFYAVVVAASIAAGGVIGVLHYGVGVPMLQSYYAVLLSALWVHYLWDHATFRQLDALSPALPAPSRA